MLTLLPEISSMETNWTKTRRESSGYFLEATCSENGHHAMLSLISESHSLKLMLVFSGGRESFVPME